MVKMIKKQLQFVRATNTYTRDISGDTQCNNQNHKKAKQYVDCSK